MLSTLVTSAAEHAEHGDPAVHPYLVGAIAFGILLALVVALLVFGKGREHT